MDKSHLTVNIKYGKGIVQTTNRKEGGSKTLAPKTGYSIDGNAFLVAKAIVVSKISWGNPCQFEPGYRQEQKSQYFHAVCSGQLFWLTKFVIILTFS
jgi:hypothetical protein